MTLEDRVHLQRLRLFGRVEELSNVSAACREAGVARSLYYQLRSRYLRYGSDGLHPKHRRGRSGRPPGVYGCDAVHCTTHLDMQQRERLGTNTRR